MDGETEQTRRERAWGGYLGGRAGRKEYWLSVTALMGLSAGLNVVNGRGAPALSIVLLLFQVRRAHDFNRSGWWAMLAQLSAALVLLLPLPIDLKEIGVMLWGLAVTIIFGVIAGSPDANRFGPPPPATLRAIYRRR